MSDHDNTDTWDMPVRFKPIGDASGGLWIKIEQLSDPTLPILEQGFLGFDLREGTTIDEAKEIATMLDRKVMLITYTGLKRPEWADNPGRSDRAKRTKH